MNTLSYYNRQKEDWSENELTILKEEYEIKELTISQIADLHKRTPGSISYRLKQIGLLGNSQDARGYPEYKTSSLYKEIVECGKKYEKTKKKDIKTVELQNSNSQNSKEFLEIKIQYLELKNDVLNMRNDIQEILRLMKHIYTLDQE